MQLPLQLQQQRNSCNPMKILKLLLFSLFLIASTFICIFNCSQVWLNLQDSEIMDTFPITQKSKSIKTLRENQGYPPILTVAPAILEDGATVTVTWKNIPQPHKNDYVTISCGPTNDVQDFMYSKPVPLSSVDTDLETEIAAEAATEIETEIGTGSIEFENLYMLRCNYKFIYFNYNVQIQKHTPLAMTEAKMKDPFTMPKQGHVSFTWNIDEIVVVYTSASTNVPQVKYGKNPKHLLLRAKGNYTTYTANDLCEGPGNITSQEYFRHPGYFHKIILKKLQPDTLYYYRYGNDHDGWSDLRQFRTRPKYERNEEREIKFIAYADMGTDNAPGGVTTASLVLNEILSNNYDNFLLHFGDISYARGRAYIWDWYLSLLEPFASRIPYLASIGNHEYGYFTGGDKDPSNPPNNLPFQPKWGNYANDSGGECSVPMVHRFPTPDNGKGIYWYSFNYGNVHVLQMSSEHNYTSNSEQYLWIKNDLENVDRHITPWVVVTAHRMMYTTQLRETADYEVSLQFRKEIEDLFVTNKVDLMLVGHQHSYERSCPVYQGKCTNSTTGIVHVVAGTAGFSKELGGFSSDLGNWSLVHINDYGYLRIKSTYKEMNVQFILNKNSEIYDEFILHPKV